MREEVAKSVRERATSIKVVGDDAGATNAYLQQLVDISHGAHAGHGI